MSERKYLPLKKFLKERSTAIHVFQKECALSTTYTSLILNGHTVPSLPTQKLIEMTLKKMFPADNEYIEQMLNESWP